MNIIVCVKFTPDAADIQVLPNGSISVERAEWIIGGFDLQAIEAGVRIAEADGSSSTVSKVTALSAGPLKANNSKLKKDVLSRGPDELALIADDALANADTALTAAVLAAAVRKLGGADLILCGEGSADLYFQQVGLQLGELLGLPTLNAISAIQVEGDHLVVERSLEEEVEVLEVPLPAVLSVTVDIHQPRLPTMKEILKASKKPVSEWKLADLELPGEARAMLETLSVKAPHQRQRKNITISSTPEEEAQALLGYLSKEGIL